MSHAPHIVPRSQSQPPYFAGIDLGGTSLKVGLVDDLGNTLAHLSEPTQAESGPEDGARRMGQAVHQAAQQAGLAPQDIARVGLATPGTMDLPAGMLLKPHNLPGWYDFPIRDRVSHHCGLPVTYSNDANAAAFGEFWLGCGKAFHSMVFLTLGTGVGGGIIIGDMSIEGEHSTGAECGHIVIDYGDDARVCPCGRRGHLEAYASATAIIRRTEEALDAGRASTLDQHRQAGAEMTPLLIAQEAGAGDELAMEIIADTARYLGVGIQSIVHVIDPDGVVLGGAMTFGGGESALGRWFIEQVRHEVCQRSLEPIAENLIVEFATLGGDAGYIGAAGLARIHYYRLKAAPASH